MKIVAIVQARMGSTRFPGKVMKSIDSIPMIELLFKRLEKAQKVDKVVLATTNLAKDDSLASHISELGFSVFRGDEKDVLDRYYQCAKEVGADHVIRITGDCPLVDPNLVDDAISIYLESEVDYITNGNPPTYPDGMDIEIMSFDALKKAWDEATREFDREHVTPYLRESGKFKTYNISHTENLSHLRWTVDEKEDFEIVEKVFLHFSPDIYFSWQDVLMLESNKPEIFKRKVNIERNEGAQMGTGQKLWKRAKNIIPGGNMLLSKRPEMFLPDAWPAYYSKAKGCHVWDLDGNKFLDMSIMGIGTNILGYGNEEVDNAVINAVRNGNMSTLNCPEEVELAERLIDLHPWADMARFARTGGEANAIAIRIARAASGRDGVAICGYHGWHDWYLAANLGDTKELDGHLLPGLEPHGVPRNLQKTVFPFQYNNFQQLKDLVEKENIGVIKMEVSRNEGPRDKFLQNVRKLASEKNIVLIFDECTSGFRETFGGLHKKYGVDPDMAMFGKALGNGYAITATIGRREVMEAAQSTFISSTFWTERIGPVAALKTLEEMEKTKSWEVITNTGREITQKWHKLAQKYDLPIKTQGLPALISFSFELENWLECKTFITQEMLKNGILAASSVYVSVVHQEEQIADYFNCLEEIFKKISEVKNSDQKMFPLEVPTCHSGFRRLN